MQDNINEAVATWTTNAQSAFPLLRPLATNTKNSRGIMSDVLTNLKVCVYNPNRIATKTPVPVLLGCNAMLRDDT